MRLKQVPVSPVIPLGFGQPRVSPREVDFSLPKELVVWDLRAVKILALYISEGHNFVGHHGKPASDYQIMEKTAIECVSGKGIRGDRFFDYKTDFKGQITFFSYEVGMQLFQDLKIEKVDLTLLRRNVITEGVDLNQWIGQKFEIQGVEFQGVEECKPCYWMDQAIGVGAEAMLKGNGGLRAKILCDGVLKKSDQS